MTQLFSSFSYFPPATCQSIIYTKIHHTFCIVLSATAQGTQALHSQCSCESRSDEKYFKGISLFLLITKKTWDIYLKCRCPWNRCFQPNEINPLPMWLALLRWWNGSNNSSRHIHIYEEFKESLNIYFFFLNAKVIFKLYYGNQIKNGN